MKYLNFDDFELGFNPLDEQHRTIVTSINALTDLIFQLPSSKDETLKLLNEIEKYAYFHFGFEYELMRTFKCPAEIQIKHSQHHDVGIEAIKKLKEEIKTQSIIDKEALNSILPNWFIEHEKTYDSILAKFVKTRI